MILAGSTLAQSYLAEGYQTALTGNQYTYPNPPTSSSAWLGENTTISAVWAEETLPGSP